MRTKDAVSRREGGYLINLDHWRGTNTNRVLSGREFGEAAREEAGLSELDNQEQATIEVHVPRDFIAVTSSFFRGMFGNSIRTLGEDTFRQRYVFSGKKIDRVREDGIRDALREKLPLDRPSK